MARRIGAKNYFATSIENISSRLLTEYDRITIAKSITPFLHFLAIVIIVFDSEISDAWNSVLAIFHGILTN